MVPRLRCHDHWMLLYLVKLLGPELKLSWIGWSVNTSGVPLNCKLCDGHLWHSSHCYMKRLISYKERRWDRGDWLINTLRLYAVCYSPRNSRHWYLERSISYKDECWGRAGWSSEAGYMSRLYAVFLWASSYAHYYLDSELSQLELIAAKTFTTWTQSWDKVDQSCSSLLRPLLLGLNMKPSLSDPVSPNHLRQPWYQLLDQSMVSQHESCATFLLDWSPRLLYESRDKSLLPEPIDCLIWLGLRWTWLIAVYLRCINLWALQGWSRTRAFGIRSSQSQSPEATMISVAWSEYGIPAWVLRYLPIGLKSSAAVPVDRLLWNCLW